MEIEEFIEQDILIYLDEILEKVRAPDKRAAAESAMYLTRDYEKELFLALDKRDVPQAKQVLHALKEQFDQCPSGTQDKEQLRTLLLELYKKFKDHIDTLNKLDQMNSALDDTLAPDETTVTTPTIVSETNEVIEPAGAQMPDVAYLQAMLDDSELHFVNGELHEAVDSYRLARQRAIEANVLVPSDLAFRYKTLYARIKFELSKLDDETRPPSVQQSVTYNNSNTQKSANPNEQLTSSPITTSSNSSPVPRNSSGDNIAISSSEANVKQSEEPYTSKITNAASTWKQIDTELLNTAGKENAQHGEELPALPAVSPKELDKESLMQLEREKQILDQMLKKNDLAGSMLQYKRMRTIAQQLNDTAVAEETAQKLLRIYDLINTMKSHAANNEAAIMSVP